MKTSDLFLNGKQKKYCIWNKQSVTFSRKRAKRAHSTGSRQAWRKKLRFDPTEIYTEETRTNTRKRNVFCLRGNWRQEFENTKKWVWRKLTKKLPNILGVAQNIQRKWKGKQDDNLFDLLVTKLALGSGCRLSNCKWNSIYKVLCISWLTTVIAHSYYFMAYELWLPEGYYMK